MRRYFRLKISTFIGMMLIGGHDSVYAVASSIDVVPPPYYNMQSRTKEFTLAEGFIYGAFYLISAKGLSSGYFSTSSECYNWAPTVLSTRVCSIIAFYNNEVNNAIKCPVGYFAIINQSVANPVYPLKVTLNVDEVQFVASNLLFSAGASAYELSPNSYLYTLQRDLVNKTNTAMGPAQVNFRINCQVCPNPPRINSGTDNCDNNLIVYHDPAYNPSFPPP